MTTTPGTGHDRMADGRRARRERNRLLVIDSMFALLSEGHVPPSVDDVAARSGVSVSSVFRYFDGLDDLHEQTIERYFERFAALFELPDPAGTAEGRIRTFVDARLDLYGTIAPIARMARLRAPEHPRIATTLHATRAHLAAQVRTHFAPDLGACTAAEADDRVAVIDSLTSFEAWDLLRAVHGRSRRQMERAWTAALRALLA